MTQNKMKTYIILYLIFFASACFAQSPQEIFFEKNIRPILSKQCYSCHSSSIKDSKGGLTLDTRDGLLKGGDSGPSILPGDPENSLLMQAMMHDGYEMPPDKKLPENILKNFYIWIKMGAYDPRINDTSNKKTIIEAKKLWSFKPLLSSFGVKQNTNGIDHLVNSKLIQEKLKPVSIADDYTIIRRLYTDIIGVLPKPIEIISYVNNKDPNKYERLVDKLLSDKRYGEKWARFWLDIVRYADSTGKDQNIVYPYAWKYRDYVIFSFNNDKKYKTFITEQIAGDLIQSKDYADYNNNLIATGFLAIGTKNLNVGDKQYKADLIDEQIDVISRGFLGITLSCARCHDHKFDAFSQEDYYRIYAILENTETHDGVKRGNNNSGYQGKYGYLINDLTKDIYHNKDIKTWQILCEINNIYKKLDSIYHYNKNLNENDKKAVQSEIDKLNQRLEEIYKNTSSDIKNLSFKMMLNNNPVMCVHDLPTIKPSTKLQIRGEINNLGDEIHRGLPEIFQTKIKDHNPTFSKNSGRIELANWIVNNKNPLTYRVHINRIWKQLIGNGIVDSFDNFGILAGEPSNLKLMDYLASSFIKNETSNKWLIKHIVMSDTYKRSCDYDQENYEKDPDNIYFWRMNEKRLTAEAIRDIVLDINDKLLYLSKDNTFLLKIDRQKVNSNIINKEIDNRFHRSIYLPVPRDLDIEMLDLFDRPDNNLMSTNRAVTTVPTQALYLMNNNKIMDHCEESAKKLLYNLKDKSHKEKIDYLYLQYLSRPATETETNFIQEFIDNSPDKTEDKIYSNIIQVLLSTGEFKDIK